MPRSRSEKQYLPSVPSPLNPDAGHDCPRAKRHRRPRPVARQTPTLSYAQHILRAKAAEAWRSEALRRGYREDHHHQHSNQEQDITDSPLSRAALDMHRGSNDNDNNNNNNKYDDDAKILPPVDLEHSLGLDPLLAHMAEKPSFGLLQPFTVDLSAVGASNHRPPQQPPPPQPSPCRGVARKALLVVGLLCLWFCLLPSMRYRAGIRQGMVVRVTS